MTHPIPDAALAQHVIALGKTGSGKSSALRSQVERLLDAGKPVCIVDPKGDWYGLRSAADGRSPGYPIVIFGGDHADVPINAHAGAAVAELVATGNRPALIDLGGWMVGERTRFWIDFASTLFRTTRGPRWLVIDEVHNFAPQGKILDPDAGKALHWSNRLASEGRGKGLTILAASQRPQKVHKDFLTSAETLIALRVVHPLDRGAIKDWIDGCPDPAKGREVLTSLASLPRGEAWVWSPEIGFGPERIRFPLFRTFDSFSPRVDGHAPLAGWAEVDLADVRARLAAVVEETEANDPRALRARIAELEGQLSRAAGCSPEDVGRARRAGYDEGVQAGREEAESAIAAKVREAADLLDHARAILDRYTGPPSSARTERLGGAQSASLTEPEGEPRTVNTVCPPTAAAAPKTARALGELARAASAKLQRPAADLPAGQRTVLTALIQYPAGLTREQLTVLAGYKRSTRDLYLQQLGRLGYVEAAGDRVVATRAGVAALPDARPLPTGAALRRHWLERLPAGERKVLEVLIAAYPRAVARDALSERSGYLRSTRDLYVQQLQRRQLVTTSRGEVRASETLF